MRFGVLGPLAAWTTAGEVVTIPEKKVRALLAALLIHEGRTVSADRLIDDLWGDDLPGNPTGALQAKVSQLRRALEKAEPGSRNLVVHQPPGYRLDVQPDDLDVMRFTALVERARADPLETARRAALLTEALALWRGPALADFADSDLARGAVTRWEELQLVAVEEQAEARLSLGEHRQLAAELGQMVKHHPLRERLRAHHMTALYRSGRQTEALESYDTLRTHLVDELGLDPSPELTALHLAILEQSPDLATPSAPDERPGPGWGSAPDHPRGNVPAPLTDLVGRGDQLAELPRAIKANRLVTLTGAGGVGKTRLAIEAGRWLAGHFPDGVWWVELAALDAASGPGQIADLVATSLQVRDSSIPILLAAEGGGPGDPTDAARHLTAALRSRHTLVIIDNCEHVIGAAAELTEQLLASAPDLHVLATSRESLGINGEVLQAVPPLDVPSVGAEASSSNDETLVTRVKHSSAARLFAERAAAAAPGFELGEDNAAAVAKICRRLDGIPLALELAATRVRALGVHQLAERIDERFQLLTGGRRTAPERQQTLWAMIAWSWELLTEPEATVLERMAVHVDGCTLEAAEHTCSGDGIEPAGVLDLLASLVDRSLVSVTDTPDGPRYRLLESVAAYGIERLQETGELNMVKRRHAEHYAALAEKADQHLRGHAQQEWLRRLDADSANVRSALDSATQLGDAALALRVVNAHAWYWFLRGRLGEARRAFAAALALVPVDRDGRSPTGVDQGQLAAASVWVAALPMLAGDTSHDPAKNDTVLAPYDKVDDPLGRARAEWLLGYAEFGFGDLATSTARVERALEIFTKVGDDWGTAAALGTRSAQATFRGDLAAMARDGQQSLDLFRELGDGWGELQALDTVAMLAEITGDDRRGAELHRDSLRTAEALGLWTAVSYHLAQLGRLALLAGDYEASEALHGRARQLAADQANLLGEEFAEIGLALTARRQGKLDAAEAHLERWLAWNRELKAGYGTALILAELGFVAELRGDAETALELHTEGLDAARTTGDPRAIALALEGLAGAHALGGRHEQAAQLLGAAAAARESVGAPLPPGERTDVDRISRVATIALGPEAFATQLERGRAAAPDPSMA